ncbi:hypothetical protein ACIQZB_32845 [Streptomyces sp. NPDC097727]|uniref:hypothetical protein n=1 Tax=Streptomyces sp. NPDC097727 TaxID=3366092 RepID=UPI003828B3A9
MKHICRAAGLALALLFLVLGIGAQAASAHVTREHAELVVAPGDTVTSGRLIVHNAVVAPEQAGAWAAGLLSAPCPATGSGVPGDNGGVPGGASSSSWRGAATSTRST